MSHPTPADFKARFPQFAAESDDRIQMFMDEADPYFDVNRWAKFYVQGYLNCVAHKLVLANYQATQTNAAAMATDVSMKKVDAVAVQRDPGLLNLSAKDPFNRTIYGQEYLRLRRMIGAGALAI